jgi:DNA-binding transcriptional MocR family regulator
MTTSMSATRLASQLGAPGRSSPAYQWLADRLRGQILDGRIVVGDRVPSERTAALAFGLSRTTVTTAYTLLRAEGYLVSRQGSNTVVALPADAMDRPDDVTPAAPAAGGEIDLTVAALPAPPMLGALAVEAAHQLPAQLGGHGLHPMGLRPLRAAIAARFTRRGLPTTVEQILITQGALHGWDLVLRALLRPGDTAVVEQPTYPAVLDAARSHSARLVPLGVGPTGWQPLRQRKGTVAPVLAHVVPEFQNPTGHRPEDAQRSALFRWLPETRVGIDETCAELDFDTPRPPMAAADRTGTAITVGTLSKTVWAGLRVGWIRADAALVRRIAMLRGGQDLATPVLDQLLAVACLDHLDEILPERVRTLARRRDHLLAAIEHTLPDWRSTRPDGGLALWVDLGARSSTQLALDARGHGVRVTAGPRFSVTGTHDRFVRLPFCLPEPVLTEAVARLGRAVSGQRATDQDAPDPTRAWTA